ncbi:unnamed protein product [Parnassius apollo]|uniref:(apollo) hypothetical protein n=1 Tax=Parnassius apollo TaxID=110799 RepID=A0A8S3W6P8_PARAO|nr:unnamed protein product [Parnassius apollo]
MHIGQGCIDFLLSWSHLYVTEQNLVDRVRYILRSNIFDDAELERLRREAVPSSNENATAEDAVPQVAEQPAHVYTSVNNPVVADRNDDGTFAQELEIQQMRSTLEEAIMETRSKPLENRPRSPKQAESGCREGSEPNNGDLLGSQPGPLRYGLNSFWRRAGSLPYHRCQVFYGWTCYWPK